MATLINKGLETSIAKKTVTYDFARLMKAEGVKDLKEVKGSEFADPIVDNR